MASLTNTIGYTFVDGEVLTAAKFVLLGVPTISAGYTYAFGDGSAAAPAITFNSDSDNGFYYIGANNFGIAVAGATVGNFSSTGLNNCAIGATTPLTGAFTSLTATLGVGVTGGSPGQGTITFGATNGLVVQAKTGATYDYVLASAAGGTVAAIPTGTTDFNVQGALKLGNAYVATPKSCTGTVTIKDSAGVTYNVLVST